MEIGSTNVVVEENDDEWWWSVVIVSGVAGKRSCSMSEQPEEPISMPMMGAGRLEVCEE